MCLLKYRYARPKRVSRAANTIARQKAAKVSTKSPRRPCMLCTPTTPCPRKRGRPRKAFEDLKPGSKCQRRWRDGQTRQQRPLVVLPAVEAEPKKRGRPPKPYDELSKEGRRTREYRTRRAGVTHAPAMPTLLLAAAATQPSSSRQHSKRRRQRQRSSGSRSTKRARCAAPRSSAAVHADRRRRRRATGRDAVHARARGRAAADSPPLVPLRSPALPSVRSPRPQRPRRTTTARRRRALARRLAAVRAQRLAIACAAASPPLHAALGPLGSLRPRHHAAASPVPPMTMPSAACTARGRPTRRRP